MEKNTQTAVDKITKTILAGIENGTFEPGSALPAQRYLAEYFDVSRNVIREAVKVLEGLGILYSKQGSGIYVRNTVPMPQNPADQKASWYTLRQILDLCRSVWHSAMLDVVKNASDSELKHLKKMTEKMLADYSSATVHQKFIYESSFGMNICQLSENLLANDMLRELLKATTEIDYKIISHTRYRKILEIDASIIDALLSRDAYRAFFLANERDFEIEKLIQKCDDLMNKTYAIYIHS